MSSFSFWTFFISLLHPTCKRVGSTRVDLLTHSWPPHVHTCSQWALGPGHFGTASPRPAVQFHGHCLGDFASTPTLHAPLRRAPWQSSAHQPEAWVPLRHLVLHMIGLIYSRSIWKVLHSKGPHINTHITLGYFTLHRASLPVWSSGSPQVPYNIGIY